MQPQPQILVVADPPHGVVDHPAVADILGLDLQDARLKIMFWAPEVLMASDPDRADEMATALTAAGMSISVIDGFDLADLPWPQPVSTFRFEDDALVAQFEGRDIRIGYHEPVVGVFCKPPANFPPGGPEGATFQVTPAREGDRAGIAAAEAIEWLSNLDLYFRHDGELQRVSIVEELVDFSGLGPLRRPTAAENMIATLTQCARRFTQIQIDTRLDDVRPRARLVGGAAFDLDMRKLFSFGTLLLRQVLDAISPELRDLTQYEFGSRLAWVLRQASPEARTETPVSESIVRFGTSDP